MMTRLDPPIPVFTSHGNGLACFLIDYGYEHDLIWVVFLDMNGECWSFKNRDIRIQRNITHGRAHLSPFYNPDDICLKHRGVCY